MATTVLIQGGPEQAKLRHPLSILGLTIITLGIYPIFWWYRINLEMSELGRKNGRTDLGTRPGLSLVAIFPGAILVVPWIWTFVTTYQRCKRAQQLVGVPIEDQANPVVYALPMILGGALSFMGDGGAVLGALVSLVSYIYLQMAMNAIWTTAAPQVSSLPPTAPPAGTHYVAPSVPQQTFPQQGPPPPSPPQA